MDELSFVTARQWGSTTYGTYLVGDSRWGPGGLFLGVVDGSREQAITWGRSVASSRANADVATTSSGSDTDVEHPSTGECETLISDRPARTRETSGGPDR